MNNKPYVFISYAHYDSGKVLPVIESMQKSGINLWYDDGVQAGSEWPEFIAEKVASCTKFVLFMSNAYLSSQNCKRELNFAVSRKKDILTIYIEDVELSLGMEMQLGTYQAIYKNRFKSDADFCASLCSEICFNDCRDKKVEEKPPVVPPQEPTTPPTPPTPPEFAVSAETEPPVKKLGIAVLLSFLLGFIGIQKFYLKKPWLGVLCILLCSTYIPAIWGIIEGIYLLVASKEKLEQMYKCKFI